jgi:hypothetical protein
MKMKPPSGPKKQTQTNPIKACPERSRMGQFPKGQNELKIACRKIRPHPTVITLAEVVAKFTTNRYYQELICPIPMSDVCNI